MNAMKISDTVDFEATLQCLRHSIMNEFKKIENAKMSLIYFTSSIAVNPLKPLKLSSTIKKHKHIANYQSEITKLKNTIMKYCIDSNSYIIGYSNIDKTKTTDAEEIINIHNLDEVMYYFTDVFDSRMFFEFAGITHHNIAYFSIANSFNKLADSFEKMAALFLYERHNFTLMIPVRADFEGLMKKNDLMQKEVMEENIEEVEEDEFEE